MIINEKTINEGVYLASYTTDKFKSALMTVSFAVPLDRETASGYSLLTNLLSLSTAKYPSMQAFSTVKDELYALSLDSYVQRRGELLLVRLEINTLGDSYAFGGERLLLKATELLGEAIFNPNFVGGGFDEKSVETEKAALIEEIESEIENKPSYALLRAREILCPDEPFSVSAAGEVGRVGALNGKRLTEFYREIIDNAPVFIAYSGEADFEYLSECVEKNLKFLPRRAVLPSPVFHQPREIALRVRENMDIGQSILTLGFSLDKIPVTKRERAVLTVFDEIFGGSSTSRLFMNVREKEGLCYYCSSYPALKKNIIFVTCGLENGYEEKAEKAILNELDSLKRGEITDSELENAKKSILRGLKSIENSLGSINGYLLSHMLSEEKSTVEATEEAVKTVTLDEVAAFAKTVELELSYILGAEG